MSLRRKINKSFKTRRRAFCVTMTECTHNIGDIWELANVGWPVSRVWNRLEKKNSHPANHNVMMMMMMMIHTGDTNRIRATHVWNPLRQVTIWRFTCGRIAERNRILVWSVFDIIYDKFRFDMPYGNTWRRQTVYSCEMCTKSLTRNSYLKNRMRTRGGDKPYIRVKYVWIPSYTEWDVWRITRKRTSESNIIVTFLKKLYTVIRPIWK